VTYHVVTQCAVALHSPGARSASSLVQAEWLDMASERAPVQDRLLRLTFIDRAPVDRPPPPLRVALATLVAVAGSVLIDAGLVAAGTALWPSIRGYSHFRLSDYGLLTVLGVLAACASWPVVVRLSSRPRSLFVRLAVVVTVALLAPDAWLLVVLHEPARAVAVLLGMHLAIAVVTYNALVHLAPPIAVMPDDLALSGDASGIRAVDAVASSTNELSAERRMKALKRLLVVMSVAIWIEFGLGVADLFAVPFSRPSGWLPTRGKALYLAHAIVGLPLGLCAVSLVITARSAERTPRLAAWIGLVGVALAGAGGLMTASHGLRLLGMALMFLGPPVAGFGYLIPALDRVPQPAPEPPANSL
jgi:hypothetical protein